jgi:Zn ribbon nucleic-acid-binding protein
MANEPRPPKLNVPIDAVKMECVNCGKDKSTRAMYQHDHEETVVTYEMPAYTDKKREVPYNWPCPCGEKHVWAVYVECGECGYIGRVDNENKRVVPPKKEA